MLKGLNPFLNVVKHNTMLTSANALEILKDYDVIADGTDNFQTRYLVNDACVLLNKPNAYGSIFRFEGQASVFGTKEGPCYRCLYPEPPPPGLVPSCAEGGVLGILPGLVGVIQATETIKLILGIGEPLIGRLLLVDALGMSFRTLKLRKNPDCPVCGTNPTVTELIDYDQFCGIAKPSEVGPLEVARDKAVAEHPVVDGIPQITVEELKHKLDAKEDIFVLDVREPHEYPIANLGAPLIPVGEVETPYRRTGRSEEPRGRRPLPFRRSQPEGCAHAEAGWIYECLESGRRHPRVGRQDRPVDAEVLNQTGKRKRRANRFAAFFLRNCRLSLDARSLQCGTQHLERSIDHRRREAQNLRDERINIHVLKRLQLNAGTNIRPRGKEDRLHLRHRARIEAVTPRCFVRTSASEPMPAHAIVNGPVGTMTGSPSRGFVIEVQVQQARPPGDRP